jgi:DNA repair protein RadC
LTRARDVANVLSTATNLATDTETAAAISSHNSSTTSVHGIADTSILKIEALVSVSSNIVDTTSARTITLPASATAGDEIQIVDASNNAQTNNITVLRNSHKINGVADDAIIDTNGGFFIFIYTGSSYGWRFM